jgi:hydrogenase nickel incorporation protein HypA/HybF
VDYHQEIRMHELSITKTLIEMAQKECAQNNIAALSRIIVELGELTAYKSEPMLFYFNILKKENPVLRDTGLEIKTIRGRIRCNSCNNDSNIQEAFIMICPLCSSADVEILQGKDLILKQIEGEKNVQ